MNHEHLAPIIHRGRGARVVPCTANAPLHCWLDAMVEAAFEIAATALCFPEAEVGGYDEQLPPRKAGAFIPLVSDRASLQLGLLFEPEDGARMARALLAMGSDEALTDEDVHDAMGEIVNILAGGVKHRMLATDSSLRLGLPMLHPTTRAPIDRHETALARIRLGPAHADLVILRQLF